MRTRRLAAVIASSGLALWAGVSSSIAQCDQPAANCQGFSAASALSTAGIGGAGNSDVNFATVADDFFVGAGGSIGSVCFWGRYRIPPGSGSADQAAATESFRVSYYPTNAAGTGPDTGAALAQFTIGGAAPSPGTTLVRVGGLGNAPLTPATSSAAGMGPGYAYTASHPAVSVAPGTRVWIEIAGASSTPDGSTRFRWMLANQAPGVGVAADGRVSVAPAGGVYEAATSATGAMAFCVDSGLGASPLPLAANATCAGAMPVTIGGVTAFDGALARGGTDDAPYCKSRVVSGPTLWYSVVGDGTTLTASTCSGATNFDTVINIYCGPCGPGMGGAGGLNCVASNDSGPPSCLDSGPGDASSVRFGAGLGVEYKVAVFGYQGASGSFALSITSDGASAPGAGACASDRCPLTGAIGALPASSGEIEACGGADVNASCASAGVGTLGLGQSRFGSISGADADTWELSPALGPWAWARLTLNVEFPAMFMVRTGACSGTGTPTDGLMTSMGAAAEPAGYCVSTERLVQADATGRLRVLITGQGTAPACGSGNAYVLRLESVVTGACCAPGQACAVMPPAACGDAGGAYLGDMATCSVPSGRPDLCAAALCCKGSTCAVVDKAYLCAASAAPTIGATAVSGACNASGNVKTPCCYADFDKSGAASIDDIFIYLNAWFDASPYAKVGGDGVAGPSIDDIFVYLNAWFGGC
jgi:hypothetical protein